MMNLTISVAARKPPFALVKEIIGITRDSVGDTCRRIASGMPLYSTAACTERGPDRNRTIRLLLACLRKHGCTAICTENGRIISEQALLNILLSSEREARHQRWLDDQGHA